MTDEELIQRVQDDELRYLGDLFERYSTKLYRYFLKGSGDTYLSEDLTQIVFEKVLKSKHTFRHKTVFAGWLFTIARNRMIERHRSHSRQRTEALENYDIMEKNDQLEVEELKDRKLRLARTMQSLKDEHLEILMLTRLENLNYQEVANYIGISEIGVKARVFRAMKNLKKAYFAIN